MQLSPRKSSCTGITFTRMRICSAGLDHLLFYSFDRASSTMNVDITANLKLAKKLVDGERYLKLKKSIFLSFFFLSFHKNL